MTQSCATVSLLLSSNILLQSCLCTVTYLIGSHRIIQDFIVLTQDRLCPGIPIHIPPPYPITLNVLSCPSQINGMDKMLQGVPPPPLPPLFQVHLNWKSWCCVPSQVPKYRCLRTVDSSEHGLQAKQIFISKLSNISVHFNL